MTKNVEVGVSKAERYLIVVENIKTAQWFLHNPFKDDVVPKGYRKITHQVPLNEEKYGNLPLLELKENQMNEISKEELERIVKKQSEVIKQLHNYIFMNENIKEEEREFLLAILGTVIRLY